MEDLKVLDDASLVHIYINSPALLNRKQETLVKKIEEITFFFFRSRIRILMCVSLSQGQPQNPPHPSRGTVHTNAGPKTLSWQGPLNPMS